MTQTSTCMTDDIFRHSFRPPFHLEGWTSGSAGPESCLHMPFGSLCAFPHVPGPDRTNPSHLQCSLILLKKGYDCKSSATLPPPHLQILHCIPYAGVLLATGAFQSRPNPILLVDAGTLLLGLHRQSLVVCFWYGSQCLPCSPTCVIISDASLDHVFFPRHECPQPFTFQTRTLTSYSFPTAIPETRLLSASP